MACVAMMLTSNTIHRRCRNRTAFGDATLRFAFQLAASGSWNPAADVNHDNHITSRDALMIMQAAAGAITL